MHANEQLDWLLFTSVLLILDLESRDAAVLLAKLASNREPPDSQLPRWIKESAQRR
jgi:hypothetical protein